MKKTTREKRVLALIRDKGILKTSDLKTHGKTSDRITHRETSDLKTYALDRMALKRLHDRGLVDRIGHGLYISTEAAPSSQVSLAVASRRVEHGVVCLLSALVFHGLTTQSPREVWMAIEWKPTVDKKEWPPMRFFRFSGKTFTQGMETHVLQGTEIKIRVYNPAKTVADCFKYRNKIGLDVALEALRDSLNQRKASRDEIWTYAKICRVQNVMRPYLEANA